MTRESVLEEIQSVDTTNCSDGLSFRESFSGTKKLTPVEELLYFCNCEKYYYNYTEKRLRQLEINVEKVIHFCDDEETLFVCKDLEDEGDIEISAYQFGSKIVCYQDTHKVVTYDDDTKHYECFFVNLSDEEINAFYLDIKNRLPEELTEKMFNPSGIHEEGKKESPYDILADAFKSICEYLYKADGEISEIKFYNVPDGVQVDLVTSRLWKPGESS